MTNIVKTDTGEIVPAWTDAEVIALKDQIAKDANPEEMKLFLYTATQRGLNPLLKQIYCIHRGGRMTIQTSIDGYRLIANRTGKLAGIKRGVKYNDKGELTHGWAEVYRSDWTHPACEEASFKEYDQKQGQWGKMPETMIKKVAEAAALRMAFPEDLSGLYTDSEMDQADRNGPVSQAELQKHTEDFKKIATPETVAAIDLYAPQVKPVTSKQKELKACADQITKLMDENQLSAFDMQEITGLETLNGATLRQLEAVIKLLLEHISKPPGQGALGIQNHVDEAVTA